MKATHPIITCDDEDGCDQWTLDYYEALVSNWRECMEPGWQYDPYRPDVPQLCPAHARARRVHPFEPVGRGDWCGECLGMPLDPVHDVETTPADTAPGPARPQPTGADR